MNEQSIVKIGEYRVSFYHGEDEATYLNSN